MNLRVSKLVFLLSLIGYAETARATFPFGDCEEFAATGNTIGWSYLQATATLELQQSGTWSAVEQATASSFLPDGGAFLLGNSWAAAGALYGMYRVRLTLTAYSGGTGTTPPTPAELESWPPQNIMTGTDFGGSYLCGPNGPQFISTPPAEATVSVNYVYDPVVSYGGQSSALVFERVAGPPEMTIDAGSGHVAWTPAAADVGEKYVILRVSAFGFADIQPYVLTVVDNREPIALDDSLVIFEDQSVYLTALVGVLANDSDPDEDPLSASLLAAPAHGVLTLDPSGAYTYTPDAEYFGLDTFTYAASDGTLSASAEVTISIIEVNDPPAAGDDAYALQQDQALEVGAEDGLLANDGDPEGDPLTVTLLTTPRLGNLLLDPLGGFLYVPFPGVSGVDELDYVVADRHAFSNVAHVVLEISPVAAPPANRPPVFTSFPPLFAAAGEAREYSITVHDPDGDQVAVTIASGPSGANIDALLLSFTPSVPGTLSFELLADDGRGGLARQSFEVAVYAPGVPDLSVSGVDISGLNTDLSSLVSTGSVLVAVANIGGGLISTGFDVLAFRDVDGDQVYDAGLDQIFGTARSTGNLLAGGTVSVEVPVSAVLHYRDELISLFADSSLELAESNELNNVARSGLDSIYLPPTGAGAPIVEWYFESSLYVNTAPTVAPFRDTNSDGAVDDRDIPAVVFPSPHPTSQSPVVLYALRGDTGQMWCRTSTAIGLSDAFTPAIGDIDGDGRSEIVAMRTAANSVVAFDDQCAFLWAAQASVYWNNPTLADLDGDGAKEVIVAGGILNGDGTIRAQFANFPLLGGVSLQGAATYHVDDLDLDGVPEIIAGANAFSPTGQRIFRWTSVNDGAGTTLATRTPASGVADPAIVVPGTLSDSWSTVANVDGDPQKEVIWTSFQTHDEWMAIFEHDGTLKELHTLFVDTSVEAYHLGPPTAVDLDGDGVVEIVIATVHQVVPAAISTQSDILLSAYRADMSLYWRRALNRGYGSSHGAPIATAFDFDGDGKNELVFQDTQRVLILDGTDGATLYEVGVNRPHRFAGAYVTLADVDRDGSIEMISPLGGFPSVTRPRQGVMVIGDTLGRWRGGRNRWDHFAYRGQDLSRVQETPPDELSAAPDLSIARVTVDSSACPASSVVTARVANSGGRFAGRAPVRIYHGAPPSGVLLGSGSTSRALEPGEYEDVSVTLTGALPSQIHATVNDGRPSDLVASGNLALLAHTWGSCSALSPTNFLVGSSDVYLAFDNSAATAWEERTVIEPGEIPFYELRFPFPVNVETVTIQNSNGTSNGFGSSAGLSFSNGATGSISLNAVGAGTVTLPAAVNDVTWLRISGVRSSVQPRISELIVGGSYRPPVALIQEGAERYANNLAASVADLPSCGSGTTQPPLITSAPPVRANSGQEYSYAIAALGDPPLAYSLAVAPAGMTISGNLVEWTPADPQGGLHTVTVRVEDPSLRAVEQTYQILVTAPVHLVTVPSVVGLTQAAAEAALSAADLVRGGLAESSSETVPAGSIVSQYPGAGAQVSSGQAINLVISTGPLQSTVPNLVGLEDGAASQTLALAGLVRGAATLAGSTTVPLGFVISQSLAAGSLVPQSSPIDLVISAGDAGVVPDLIGRTRLDAFAALSAASLRAGTTSWEYSATVPADEILAQTPAPGTIVPHRTAVDVVASRGPAEADGDGDLWTAGQGDCDDADPARHPDAIDIAGDGIDQNCNGADSVAGDSTPPVAAITSPLEDEIVTAPVAIVGTADDANLLRYELSLAIAGTDQFSVIGAGTNATAGGVLGTLDPTLLENGIYDLRIIVEDVNAQVSEAIIPVQIQGGMKVGVFTVSFTDLAVPVSGIPITVTRTYDSRVKTKEDFGIGWKLAVAAGRVTHNRPPGEGWQFPPEKPIGWPNLVFVPCLEGEPEIRSHRTEVRLSEREFYMFRATLTNRLRIAGGCIANLVFTYIGGWGPEATLEIIGHDEVVHEFNSSVVRHSITLEIFNPNAVRLTTYDGRVVDLERTRGITRLEDRNGNELYIDHSGVVHTSGRSIAFVRDAEDRITSIVDPLGHVLQYAYSAEGDLIQFTNPLGEATTYSYSSTISHHLERILKPDGSVLTEAHFDGDGRLVRECPGGERCSSFTRELTERRETQIDATGRQSTVVYDDRGNVVEGTDGLGNSITFEYDARDNLTRRIDPVGGITTYVYDENNNLTSWTEPHAPTEDPSDYTTQIHYNARGQQTAVVLPTGARFDLQYDSRGNLLDVTDAAGTVLMGFGYDSAGRVISETDRFGTTSYTHDAFGNVESFTDPGFGETWTMTHDDGGRVLEMSNQQGESSSFVYDALGRRISADHGNGVTLSFGYGFGPMWNEAIGTTIPTIRRTETAHGELAGWIRADGSSVGMSYDEAGRTIADIDPLGRVTSYAYDAAGRLESITDRSGATTTFERDDAGRVIAEVDELGNRKTTAYGADGRVNAITDPRGNTTTFTYTPTTTTMRDMLGRETTVIRNGYGIVMETIFADDSRRSMSYLGETAIDEPEAYPLSETDEEGHVRSYAYSAEGDMSWATDRAGNAFVYGYQDGALTSVTWPNPETLSYEYDAYDRIASVTYADGGRTLYDYAANGELERITKASGAEITFTYDALDRELTRTISSPASVVVQTWDANDARTAMTDARGTTEWTFDGEGNITRVDQPSGAYVAYGRDPIARPTTLEWRAPGTSTPRTTTYEYDRAGNITKVIDPLGGETTMTYDGVNRLAERTLPNGVRTEYAYDARDRITSIVHRRPDGTVLLSETYGLHALGEPHTINRNNGEVIQLEYDEALRLTSGRTYDETGALSARELYTYDLDGNRMTRTTTSTAEVYAYDPGHQLVGIETATSAEQHVFDVDGRVVSMIGPARELALGWDAGDSLLSVNDVASSQTTTYGYDGDARLVESTGPEGVRRFVVAPGVDDGLDVVYAVADDAGNIVAGFVYAGQLPLMRFGSAGPLYYLEDRMGSIIGLVDGSGDLVAHFSYDSFGNTISATGAASAPLPGVGGDFRFQGAWLESASGLYLMRERVYDPRTGRFLSRDPADPHQEEPETFHPYMFANGNPQLFRDPTGLFSLIELQVAQGNQQEIQRVQNQIKAQLFDYAKDRVQEIVSDVIGKALEGLLTAYFGGGAPGIFRTLNAASGAFRRRGNIFGGLITDVVCEALPMKYAKGLWVEPTLDRGTGAAVANGAHLDPKTCLPGLPDRVRGPKPDLLVSKKEPKELLAKSGPFPTGLGNHSWLSAEFKISLKRFRGSWRRRQRGQMEAMVKHAQNYQYAPVLLLVAWNGGSGRDWLERELTVKENVLPLIVTIR